MLLCIAQLTYSKHKQCNHQDTNSDVQQRNIPKTNYYTIFDFCIAGGFWAVILFRAAWKRSWVGRDPTHSIIVAEKSVAIIGDMALAQLLTA